MLAEWLAAVLVVALVDALVVALVVALVAALVDALAVTLATDLAAAQHSKLADWLTAAAATCPCAHTGHNKSNDIRILIMM
jgi:hypothetical protein